jgi:transcriptional regulator with XRE-family HTH domain
MASAFGARLRRLREAKKLTLQQVADEVGCTKAYIWELEMKDGQRPSAERVQALARVLGVTMEDIMGEPIEAGSRSQSRRCGLLPRVRWDDGRGEGSLPADARSFVGQEVIDAEKKP